jgi:hypothetical protein
MGGEGKPLMLSTWLLWLERLSSSRAPQLTAGLTVCGLLVLVLGDHPLALLPFLLQRGLVIALLWSALRLPLGSISGIASIAIALLLISAELWRWISRRWTGPAVQAARPSAPGWPIRALGAALALLLTNGLLRVELVQRLPPAVAEAAVPLCVNGLLMLLLADSGWLTGFGVLSLADGLRVGYALWQPDPLCWGLWAASDVIVALGTAHLRRLQQHVAQPTPAERGWP